MKLFKSKKSTIDKIKEGDLDSRMDDLEKKKILLSAEIKKDQTSLKRLKEEGKSLSSDERRPLAYKMLRTENGMKRRLKEVEVIEREILGLDNLKNAINTRKESVTRSKQIQDVDLEELKQEAMKDRIEREKYEKKLQELSEISSVSEGMDSNMIDDYAKSIWESSIEDKTEIEKEIDKKIESDMKKQADFEGGDEDD